MLNAKFLQESMQKFATVTKVHEKEIYVALLVLIFVYLVINRILWRKYPPGPTGLPIVGYLPFLSKHLHLDFTELGKKYGDVFSIQLGSANIVILHSAKAIKEACSKSEFLGRPPNSLVSYLSKDSVFFVCDNHIWTEHRKFVVQSMKDLGLGKSKIEHEIQDEINVFLDILRDSKGQPLDINGPLSSSIANNICALAFGKRFDLNDPVRKQLDKSLENAVENVSQTAVANFFPWIIAIPFIRKFLKLEDVCRDAKTILDICQQEIDKHKKTFDPKNIRDYVDSYLIEMKSRREKDPDTSFSDDRLKGSVVDICNAGSETVRTSILWSMYTMAAYPEVQKKVQKEIFEVVGLERLPVYSDQKEMPYTHAVILEIQRWQTVVPLNILRYTTSDTKVADYNISKGTIVQANFWAVHHDPDLWDEPDTFKPERFLSPDGKSIVKPSYFMPFSLGKRACPGDIMANMEIFLYFTRILQEFDVVLPHGIKPTFSGKLGLVYVKEPYKLCYIPKETLL